MPAQRFTPLACARVRKTARGCRGRRNS
jgi:hypothetical protein